MYNLLKVKQKEIGVEKELQQIPALHYTGVEERTKMAEEIFRDIFEFDDIVIL